MAKQTAIDDKELTPAQGAEGGSENQQEQPAVDQTKAETPEWVERLIASNESVIKSNESLAVLLAEIIESGPEQIESQQAVIDVCAGLTKSFEDIKALAAITSPREADVLLSQYAPAPDFDEDSDYEVAPGKSFRDPKDFTKEYTSGDDVTHLGEEVLKRLLAQGLIAEA